MNFIPLHVYSGYSYLKSALKIEKYVKKADEYGYKYLSLTDLNNLTGAPKFVHECEKYNITPLIGEDISISSSYLTFFPINEDGYENLLKISYLSKTKEIDINDIKDLLTNIIVVLSSDSTLFKRMFIDEKRIKLFSDFAKNIKHFYIGLDDKSENDFYQIRQFADQYSYDVIAFPFIKYINKEDAIALKMLEAIDHKETLSKKEETGKEYLKNKEEIETIYLENEIEQTNKLVSLISFNFIKKRGQILHFENKDGLNSDDYLKKICLENLNKKGLNQEQYISRLNYELETIKSMGYSDYFLVVSDYVNYAKNNNILVGPGRGSAVGSLVSFALNITECDPIKYGLIFERFLNKDRQSLPDIDVDFEDIRRDEIAKYLADKYGINRVSKVLAVQRFKAKQALNDVGRIFSYDKRDIELFTKCIKKDEEKLSLRQIYKTNKDFHKLVNEDKYYLQIVSLASKIEDLPRQKGLHAAGIIINNDDLIGKMSVDVENDGTLISDFEKDYLEEQYFLKMDLLSVRNLTTVKECLDKIKETQNININFSDIPIDDEDAIKLIKSTKTMGLFQIESMGMRKAIKELEPTSFLDIALLLALYRPGPMDNIISYARRKKGLEKVNYLSNELKEILSPTFGIIVYQEQIMQIVHVMADFSFAEADLLRRAISKKNADKLASYEKQFIEGATKKGFSESVAKEVYKMIYKFGDYGFNKSHAIGYAFLTSKMAYLKAHYKKEFYASILSSSNSSNFLTTINEMESEGIKLLNPNINLSSFDYQIVDNNIIMPLTSIKGIMMMNVKDIINERKKSPFIDLFDFVIRMNKYHLVDKQIMALIDSGAFDKINPSRATLRSSLVKALNYALMVGGDDGENIIDITMFPKPKLTIAVDDKLDNLNREYQVLGLMVSDTPLKMAKKNSSIQLYSISQVAEHNNLVSIAAIIKNIRQSKTKKGDLITFLTIYDESGELDCVLFKEEYEKYHSLLEKNNIVIINGKYNRLRNSFTINSIQQIGDKEDE